MQVEISNGDVVVEASLLGELLDVAPADIQPLMQAQEITSVLEKGVDDHAGEYRLSFFFRNRRARLSIDAGGQIIRRSVVDFGDRPLPRTMHSARS